MVTENEIREPVTPWEKAALILNTIEEGHFDTPDTAIAALFPALPRTTRTRIRNHVSVVEALAPLLTDPTSLTTPPTRHPRRRAPVGARGPPHRHPPPRHRPGGGDPMVHPPPRPADVLKEPTNPTTRRPRRLLKLARA